MVRSVKKARVQEDVGGRGLSPIYLDAVDEAFENVVVMKRRNGRKRIVFGWYGGKFSHLDWLLPLLPRGHHYCEPFSGSAAVLLNREPSPVETYNDIDGDVVNFFRVLRDRGEALVRAIGLTPFSREEFHKAINGSTKRISETGAGPTLLYQGPADADRSRPNRNAWSLGELQKHEPRRHVRGSIALAWGCGGAGRNR